MLDGGRRPRKRARDAAVVERAALEEPLDGIVDLVWGVSPIVETGADAFDRQLATREHSQTLGVGFGLIHRIW